MREKGKKGKGRGKGSNEGIVPSRPMTLTLTSDLETLFSTFHSHDECLW